MTFGASISKKDTTNGNMALHWACTSGNYVVVKLLVDAGADPLVPNAKVFIFNLVSLTANIRIYAALLIAWYL